jgi:hypothetical protein
MALIGPFRRGKSTVIRCSTAWSGDRRTITLNDIELTTLGRR